MQGASELVTSLPARSDGLEVDLVGEHLPQHLPRLDRPTAQEAGNVPDAGAKPAGDLLDLHRREPSHSPELLQIGREHRLPCLLGAQACRDLVGWERAVRQCVDQPIHPLLNLG
jgi:hypothetical protein